MNATQQIKSHNSLLSPLAGVLLIALLAVAPTLNAQSTIIDWGGTEVTTTTQAVLSQGGVTGLDIINPLTASPGNYLEVTTYGGLRFANGTINRWRILNNDISGDFLQSIVNAADTESSIEQSGMFFFKQEDFANLATQSGGVTLNATTPFSVEFRVGRGEVAEIRFVIQTSESSNPFYISGNLGVTTIDDVFRTATLADPTSASWQLFTPLTSLAPTSIAGSTTIPDFTSVTGVGVWWNVSNSDPTGTFDTNLNIRKIEFNAIPEPQHFALIAGIFLLIFVVARNRFYQ